MGIGLSLTCGLRARSVPRDKDLGHHINDSTLIRAEMCRECIAFHLPSLVIVLVLIAERCGLAMENQFVEGVASHVRRVNWKGDLVQSTR